MRTLGTRIALHLAALMLLLGTASPVHASQTNGELCSVQTYDEAVRISDYAYPSVNARFATRQQIASAGDWCTTSAATPGWMGASKFYDEYSGQVAVCYVHFLGYDTALEVYSYYSATTRAEQACWAIGADHSDAILWYP